MALTAVDLSLSSKRVTPTLSMDVILGNLSQAVGSRAGVASLQVVKNLIGGGSVTVSGSAPSGPSAGDLWWDTSGNPDAGLKIRIGSSWVLVASGSTTSNSDIDDRIVSWALANSPTGTVPTARLSGATLVGVLEVLSGASRLDADALKNLITAINASTGLIDLDRLGTGTKSVETCLRGDQSFGAINPVVVSVADAEAGTSTARRTWTPQRVGQAIAALAGDGTSGEDGTPGWSAELNIEYRDPDAGTDPQFGIVIETGSERALEFEHLDEDDHTYLRGLISGTLIRIGVHHNNLFTVDRVTHTGGSQSRVLGTFESADPVLADQTDYRLRFTQSRPGEDGADGTGVATPGSLVSFQAALSSHTQIIITSTWEDVMVIAAAGINVNDGGFTTGEPTTGRNSVIIPTGEDGRYQFGLNMRVNGTASGAGARRDIKVRVVVYRASALQASPIVLGSEYFRGHADVDGFTVNMSTIGDFEAADEIRVQAQAASGSPSLDFSDETSGIWVSKVQPPLIVVAEGQQSEGASNNGSTFVRVYRAQSASTTPADPPDPYSGGEYEESFSPWTTDPPTLGSNEVLWVANGGTVLDSSNSVQNRAWQKYPTLTEQYSRHPAENNTYTLDPDEAGRPWVRSLLPTGWGPWSRRDGGGSGWIDLLTDVAAHHATDRLAVLTHTLPGTGFDADYLQEIEIEAEAFGQIDNGAYSHLGLHGNVQLRRPPGRDWTEWDTQDGTPVDPNDFIFQDTKLGSYKVRMNDEVGMTVAAGGQFLESEFAGGTGRPSDGSPIRRYSFLFHLLGDVNDKNQIRRIKIGEFSVASAYTRLSIRMR